MLELPDGITTSEGNWYHITSKQIDTYVPGLLKRYPLERIIKEADSWSKSADGLSLFIYFALAYAGITPWVATLVSLGFYFLWYFNVSAFSYPSISTVIGFLTKDGFVYALSAVLLIGIAVNTSIRSLGLSIGMDALGPGIILFFLFKVGLLRLSIKFIQSKRSGNIVEHHDRVLNMLLIRYGMKFGILTKNIDEMQDELINIANYHKTRKKK